VTNVEVERFRVGSASEPQGVRCQKEGVPFLFTVLLVHGCASERGQRKKRKQEKSEVKSMTSLWLVTKSD
ncbi:MAG: hypothetical protein MO847_12035, partial [Candidatus Protistobacter heckmanni]|nr:hypothetical protein [Candidatus Protistobacter heckmanni]